MRPVYRINETQLDSADRLMRTDWDEQGSTSVHLPRETARQLLQQCGWSIPLDHKHRYTHEQSGRWCWELDEALTLTLVGMAQER